MSQPPNNSNSTSNSSSNCRNSQTSERIIKKLRVKRKINQTSPLLKCRTLSHNHSFQDLQLPPQIEEINYKAITTRCISIKRMAEKMTAYHLKKFNFWMLNLIKSFNN